MQNSLQLVIIMMLIPFFPVVRLSWDLLATLPNPEMNRTSVFLRLAASCAGEKECTE